MIIYRDAVNITAMLGCVDVLLPASLLARLCQTSVPLFAHLSASHLASPRLVAVHLFRFLELRLHKDANRDVITGPVSARLPLCAGAVFCVTMLMIESTTRQGGRMGQHFLSSGPAQAADTRPRWES